MENKKYLPLKIVHLIFIVLGLGFYVYTLFGLKDAFPDTKDAVFVGVFTVATVCALVSGFLYLIHGYKKNAAAYFKGYVWILLIAEGIGACVAIKNGNSYIIKFAKMACVILFTMLATGKDMGKKRSFSIAGTLLVIEVALLIHYLIKYLPGIDATLLPYIFDPIEHVVLTITTIFMVCGKYIDKETRGAK